MVKSSGGQRESEGVVVPLIGVHHNAPGEKGPHFDHAGDGVTRQGMAGITRPNHPGGRPPAVPGEVPPPVFDGRADPGNVRRLQRGLWAGAKHSPERRFHALYDRVHRGDVLWEAWEAWERVRANKGAAGVDRVTLAYVDEVYGVRRMLGELQAALREGCYRPAPARRVDIPKPQGGKRPLGIPERGTERTVAGTPQGGVISPLASLGLELHPDKTKVVDLRQGREGLDFLGCHFRARMSGRLWEGKRIVRYYLHRWPSQRAMSRLRDKIRDRTGRNRAGTDIREVIADLNPVLRGWGAYFRTGNAAVKFRQADRYVVMRLHRLMVTKRGRNLRARQAQAWTEEWINGHGLYRLRGTIRYPKAA